MGDETDRELTLSIMSGPDDGRKIRFQYAEGDGRIGPDGVWVLTLGRRDDCDLCLPFDTQISRVHAELIGTQDLRWLLEDKNSRNGTFIGKKRVDSASSLDAGVLFRIGRTWLRLE